MTEDKMVGWHHRLNGHEFEQTLGISEGHGVAQSRTRLKQLSSSSSTVTEQQSTILII